jgi:hypothetical protein
MNQKGYSEGWLAEGYRQSKLTISNKIRAYRLMTEQFLAKYPAPINITKWSYFEEFYKRCKPAANTPDGADLEQDFVDWVGLGRFTKGAQVRELPRIMASQSARKALSEKGFDSAWEIVRSQNPELDSPVFRALGRATDVLQKFPLAELKEIRDGHPKKLRKLEELQFALDQILEQSGRSVKGGKQDARSSRRT